MEVTQASDAHAQTEVPLSKLDKFESFIGQLVEGAFGRLFSGRLQPIEVANALARALDDHQVSDEQGHRFAPNVFWVYLHPSDYIALQQNRPTLPDELARSVAELASMTDLLVPESPVVEIVSSEEIPRGRVSATAQYFPQETAPIGPTQEIPQEEIRQAIAAPQPIQAFLILDGQRHVPLAQPVITIGRALGNDLVIDDTRVSRYHAQLRLRNGHFMLYDTGSSGGTTVNGKAIDEHELHAGDVISLAGYAIVFGEDAPPPPEPPVRYEDTPTLPG
jgi:hypothetical protein